jgi:GNAT superfamily N-acetyltransferase
MSNLALENADAEIRHIYDQWHEAIIRKDIDRLIALYAEDAVFETPAILVTLPDRTQGMLRGRREIRPFFEAGFRKLGNELNRWYRSRLFFSNGRQLTWEYPRETPQGNQVDLVEVMDVADGLIVHHRVYWGWVGFQTLVAALNKPASTQVASTDFSTWRLATELDFDCIVAMNEHLNAEDPGETLPIDSGMMRRTLAEFMANPIRGVVAVLEIGQELCGYALLVSFWSNELGGEICALDELYVAPAYRGRGLATQFIQHLAQGNSPIWPRRTAMITVEAYRTNPRAKALYERLGFEASTNHTLLLSPKSVA